MVTDRAHQAIILVVEDEVFISKILVQELESHGHQVIKAENGAQALELIKQHEPQLILLDVIMPEMNGFDFLKHLRQRLKKNIPVIIISNLDSEHQIKTAKELGVLDYVIKSNISMRDLLASVNAALETAA